MPKGPDPRVNAAPLSEVPRLLREGAAEWNARRFWHAHESWESAWHALRAAGQEKPAEFLHGLILCAAGLENAMRGKEAGFRRQVAEGLYLMATNQEGASALGLSRHLIERITFLYVDACRRLDWAAWNASEWQAPRVETA